MQECGQLGLSLCERLLHRHLTGLLCMGVHGACAGPSVQGHKQACDVCLCVCEGVYMFAHRWRDPIVWALVEENSFMRPDTGHRLNSQHQGSMPFSVGTESITWRFQICWLDRNPETISPDSTSIPASVPVQTSVRRVCLHQHDSFNKYFLGAHDMAATVFNE